MGTKAGKNFFVLVQKRIYRELKVTFRGPFTMDPRVKSANFEGLYLGQEASDRKTVFTTRSGVIRSIFENFIARVDFPNVSLDFLVTAE